MEIITDIPPVPCPWNCGATLNHTIDDGRGTYEELVSGAIYGFCTHCTGLVEVKPDGLVRKQATR